MLTFYNFKTLKLYDDRSKKTYVKNFYKIRKNRNMYL